MKTDQRGVVDKKIEDLLFSKTPDLSDESDEYYRGDAVLSIMQEYSNQQNSELIKNNEEWEIWSKVADESIEESNTTINKLQSKIEAYEIVLNEAKYLLYNLHSANVAAAYNIIKEVLQTQSK